MIYLLAFLQTHSYSFHLHFAAGHKLTVILSCFHLVVADGCGGTSMRLLVWDTGGISSSVSAKGCAGTLYSSCGAVTALVQAHLAQYLTDIQRWSREQYESGARGDASP